MQIFSLASNLQQIALDSVNFVNNKLRKKNSIDDCNYITYIVIGENEKKPHDENIFFLPFKISTRIKLREFKEYFPFVGNIIVRFKTSLTDLVDIINEGLMTGLPLLNINENTNVIKPIEKYIITNENDIKNILKQDNLSYVWVDVNNDDSYVPLYEGHIVVKVLFINNENYSSYNDIYFKDANQYEYATEYYKINEKNLCSYILLNEENNKEEDTNVNSNNSSSDVIVDHHANTDFDQINYKDLFFKKKGSTNNTGINKDSTSDYNIKNFKNKTDSISMSNIKDIGYVSNKTRKHIINKFGKIAYNKHNNCVDVFEKEKLLIVHNNSGNINDTKEEDIFFQNNYKNNDYDNNTNNMYFQYENNHYEQNKNKGININKVNENIKHNLEKKDSNNLKNVSSHYSDKNNDNIRTGNGNDKDNKNNITSRHSNNKDDYVSDNYRQQSKIRTTAINNNEQIQEAIKKKANDRLNLLNEHRNQEEIKQKEKLAISDKIKKQIDKWSKNSDNTYKNIKVMLSTLDDILWPNSEWKTVPMSDLISNKAIVKRTYKNAILLCHPDKNRDTSVEIMLRAELIFHALNNAYKESKGI
ncbi:conserved protein, unknown function [Hepatocystis sp. ex Piliocolobus tephrosceles]|nr:conserved protein, unknown function [Hepatocystis sp. ex Piliocolobus tephrosceles]